MDEKRRQGIIDAIKGYEYKQRQINNPKKTGRKNAKPEKDVEKQILAWAKKRGLSLHVIEAKATYNPDKGRYISQSVSAGFLDIVGNYKHLALYIELKAPGKKSTLRDKQERFICSKIDQGAFACVTDSDKDLAQIFEAWLKTKDPQRRKALLYEALPKRKTKRNEEQGGLFE